MEVMRMKQIQTQIIIPKLLIDPRLVINELKAAAAENNHKYFRIFNTRSGKDCFALHVGTTHYLFRDPKYIEPLYGHEAIDLLFRLNETIKNSRFLDFEIISEKHNENN